MIYRKLCFAFPALFMAAVAFLFPCLLLADPTAVMQPMNANDGSGLWVYFTFTNDTDYIVYFELQTNPARQWGVQGPEGDYATMDPYDIQGLGIAPHYQWTAPIYKFSSTGVDDGDLDSWLFTVSQNYNWGYTINTHDFPLTTSAKATLSDTPEPASIFLVLPMIVGGGAFLRRRLIL